MPEADHLDISHPTGATNPTTPIDAAEGAGGSQLLASRHWPRALFDGRCGCCGGAGDHPCGHECDCCDGSGTSPDSAPCSVPHGADCRCDPAPDSGSEWDQVPGAVRAAWLAELETERARWGHYKRLYLSGLETAQQLRAELTEVTGQRDRLAADLRDEVAAGDRTVHRLSEALAEARAERDRAQAELHGELVAGERTIRHLTDERDTARAERDQAVSDLRAAFAGDRTLRQLKGERDAARAELVKVAADRNVARSDLASITRGRDVLSGHVDRLRRLAGEQRRELEVVGARAGWASLLAVQLRLLCQTVEQARPSAAGTVPWSSWRPVLDASRQSRQLLAKLDGLPAEAPRRQPEPDVGDHIQAQALYAGLPNLPVEPGHADEPDPAEPTDDQLTSWREHHDHTEGADHA